MKKGFWTSDWFFGLAFSVLFFVLAFALYADSFSRLETFAYDLGLRSSNATPSHRIAIIEIDDASIETIGRWPWPRDLHADMIDRLATANAKVIGTTVLFSEPQRDPGLLFIEDMAQFYDASSLGRLTAKSEPEFAEAADASSDTGELSSATSAADPAPLQNATGTVAATPGEDTAETAMSDPLPAELIGDLATLRERMSAASASLDTDAALARSIAGAGNVVLPFTMNQPFPIGRPDSELPTWMLTNAVSGSGAPAVSYGRIQPPIESIATAAAGAGHLMQLPDGDGALRFEPLALEYYDVMFPSFALVVAAKSLNLRPEDVRVNGNESITLGNLQIGTTPGLLMYNYYYNPADGRAAFPSYSFADVLQGVVPIERFRDKIVLIGGTALGVGDSFATPVSASMSPVAVVAHTVSAILQEDFFTRPEWAGLAELAAFLLIAIYLIALLPRLKPGTAAIISLALLLSLVAVEFSLLGATNMWLQLMVPAVFLVTGHLLITIKLFRVTEKIRIRSEAEGAESNRMLGLAFQGQGQLDMAFDKFRKSPMDDSLMDLLYNLALDYERKRQHSKAGAVYAYMADHNPKFRDLQQRLKRSKAMEETVVFGGSSHPGGTLVLDGDEIQKPMLGRYQVEKELGKGAMGVVYLGRDPKINRVVAIKTMALSQEFEEDELVEVKARFFREAETAGRLNHPNIVTIYDAGDEHDLAYIAMEFLKGKDLVPYTKPDNLLPKEKVFDLIAKSADALDFAHQQGVVHRDIKPANLMYEPESEALKITDFGIARITDSSKTKTGMVLGTPSYMSPEQLSGKKVDGRSDLFSLGVTLYQMLTGQLPFKADSMAALMYKISNEEHAPITLLRPDLPQSVDAIINKALAKNMNERYQRGTEMAADIRACTAALAGA